MLRWASARQSSASVLNDYTLANNLDRQFGDMPVGLREILLSMIHGFERTRPIPKAGSREPRTTGRDDGTWGSSALRHIAWVLKL